MPLTLKVVTPPTDEPVALEDAKAYLRVDDTDQDDVISTYLAAARGLVEVGSRRQLMPATYKRSLDAFPGGNGEIPLPRPPLTSVTSIRYIDQAGSWQTLSTSNYRVDVDSEPGRVTPAFGFCWPCARVTTNAVEITYVAGYADADAVPNEAKQAIMLLAAHWYEHREAVGDGSSVSAAPLPIQLAFDALVSAIKVPYLGENENEHHRHRHLWPWRY